MVSKVDLIPAVSGPAVGSWGSLSCLSLGLKGGGWTSVNVLLAETV